MWNTFIVLESRNIDARQNSPLNDATELWCVGYDKVKVLAMTMVVMVAVAPAATLEWTTNLCVCVCVSHKCAGKITARDRVAIYDLCFTFARTNFYGHEHKHVQSIHANGRARARTHSLMRATVRPNCLNDFLFLTLGCTAINFGWALSSSVCVCVLSGGLTQPRERCSLFLSLSLAFELCAWGEKFQFNIK